jgi:hypothetical protein
MGLMQHAVSPSFVLLPRTYRTCLAQADHQTGLGWYAGMESLEALNQVKPHTPRQKIPRAAPFWVAAIRQS